MRQSVSEVHSVAPLREFKQREFKQREFKQFADNNNKDWVPIITNESDIIDTLKHYVAKIWIYPKDPETGEHKEPKVYIYKRTLPKPNQKSGESILSSILAYQGSSRGKNRPSDEFMEDWKNSYKSPEITILKQNCKKCELGFLEQYHITKHRVSFAGDTDNNGEWNCYNKNNGNTGAKKHGVVSNKVMIEYISIQNLKKEITRQREKIKEIDALPCETEEELDLKEIAIREAKIFAKITLSRQQLQAIKDNNKLIQGRSKVIDQDTVNRYRKAQNQIQDLKNSFCDLQIYLPEDPAALPEIGDGNHSYFAFRSITKHQKMWGHAIPYEWHKDISRTGKENMGSWFNKPEPDASLFRSDDDILRIIRNLITDNPDLLIIKGGKSDGLPKIHSPLITEVFTDQGYDPEYGIPRLQKKIVNEYKKERYERRRAEGNVHDFRDAPLKEGGTGFQEDAFDAYTSIMNDVMEQFPEYKDNIKRVGEQKIHQDSIGYMLKVALKTGKPPERLLVVIWTSTIQSYDMHIKGDKLLNKQNLKKIIEKSVQNIEIVVINPERNSEKPTFFVVGN
jgi:hypothetical protein